MDSDNGGSRDQNEARDEKLGLYVTGALVVAFSALGAYGIVTDDGSLQVLAFCGVLPTLFGFLILLGMRMTWLD